MKRTTLYKLLSFGDKSVFDIPADEQRIYLNRLGLAKDNFERSYKQYLCQCKFKSKLKLVGFNTISALLFPTLVIYYLLKHKSNRIKIVDALGSFQGIEEVIPNSLLSQYHINNEYWLSGSSLSCADISFIWKIVCRFPISPFFCSKILIGIAGYSFMIQRFNPNAIIVHSEFSFMSSILTEYCNINGVNHINVMHGEKLYFIRDSYFHFNQCYIWGNFYKDLLVSLNAEPNQFVIEVPPSMRIDCSIYLDTAFYADYKYYLASYSEKQLKSIIASMDFAKQLGKKVVYRLHPRYSNISLLEKYVKKENIEYPDKVPIQYSISNAENIIGSYTTVLNQAYASGKHIIFDDVTFLSQYRKLKDYHYFFSEENENIRLLSKIQGGRVCL